MDKIEKSQYDITLKDLRALQNFTDWCNFYDCFKGFWQVFLKLRQFFFRNAFSRSKIYC